MKFGAFLAPFHSTKSVPADAFERDLALVRTLDTLGLDEIWFGEHHSGGSEIVASPEIMIAAAASQTRNIRFGTGVISVPYHHPLMIADRMVMLDHLTRGRVTFGFGPGALPSDAMMMGINPSDQRSRLTEALPHIVELVRGGRIEHHRSEWFELRDAELHLAPYTPGGPEMSVASMISPTGPTLAGQLELGLLSLSVTSNAGSSFLARHWDVYNKSRPPGGDGPASRASWRTVAPIHLSLTRDQARQEVQLGLQSWVDYFQKVAALPFSLNVGDGLDAVDAINESGFGVIGDVSDGIAFLERIVSSSGGFGTFLVMAHEWADQTATARSYELLLREVGPEFRSSPTAQERSKSKLVENRRALVNAAGQAIANAVRDYHNTTKEKTDAV